LHHSHPHLHPNIGTTTTHFDFIHHLAFSASATILHLRSRLFIIMPQYLTRVILRVKVPLSSSDPTWPILKSAKSYDLSRSIAALGDMPGMIKRFDSARPATSPTAGNLDYHHTLESPLTSSCYLIVLGIQVDLPAGSTYHRERPPDSQGQRCGATPTVLRRTRTSGASPLHELPADSKSGAKICKRCEP